MESPLLGAEGNREFFLHAVWKQNFRVKYLSRGALAVP